jgi:hypothetical protein
VIDKEEFADEFADLAYQAGIEETCALEFPEYMYERNERSPRSFAEVDPHGLYFAFAPQVLELDWAHRRGLIMHELGHVLCRELPGGGTERDADQAAESVFGERIIYDSAWPGKGLQCVRECGRRNPPEDSIVCPICKKRVKREPRGAIARHGYRRTVLGDRGHCPTSGWADEWRAVAQAAEDQKEHIEILRGRMSASAIEAIGTPWGASNKEVRELNKAEQALAQLERLLENRK